MNYQTEIYPYREGTRTLFTFSDKALTYEKISEAIDLHIQPDSRSEEEITSWTIGFVFEKDGISIYFEHFYSLDFLFTFELYPIGDSNQDKIARIKNLIEKLDKRCFTKSRK